MNIGKKLAHKYSASYFCVFLALSFILVAGPFAIRAFADPVNIDINQTALTPLVTGGCELNGRRLVRLEPTSLGIPYYVENTATGRLDPLPPVAAGDGNFPHECQTLGSEAFYFGAATDGHIQLVATDGSGSVPRVVADINSGGETHEIGYGSFVRASNQIFFAARTAAAGLELWRSDGTTSGTYMIRDITAGTGAGYYTGGGIAALGNKVVFSIVGASAGTWVSDGTSGGTELLSALRGALFTSFNDKVFFRVSSGSSYPFYVTDGTVTGTAPLTSLVADSNSQLTAPFFGKTANGLVFPAATGNPAQRGLFVSDGTDQGTSMLFAAPSNSSAPYVAASNGQYAIGWSSNTDDGTFFRTDGTVSGTELSAPSGLPSGRSSSYSGGGATLTNGSMILSIGSDLKSLVTIRGPSDPVVTLRLNQDLGSPLAVGNIAYVQERTSVGAFVYQMVRTDGTLNGTSVLSDTHLGTGSSKPIIIGQLNNKLILQAFTPDVGAELFSSDLTQSGTTLLKDIAAGNGANGRPKSSYYTFETNSPSFGRAINGKLIFPLDDGDNGAELWVTDGTTAGTKLLKDIFLGTDYSAATLLGEFGGKIYFSARSSDTDYELWATDGTSDGTVVFSTFNSGSAYGASPTGFAQLGNYFYFIANAPGGRGIYRSDGTETGTVMVYSPPAGTSVGYSLTASGNTLYFKATPPMASGAQLYASDGTQGGTRLVKTINATGDGVYAFLPDAVLGNDRIVFIGNDGTHGQEPWVSDGTSAGTYLLSDINSQGSSMYESPVVAMNGKVYFSPNNSTALNRVLWGTDGTTVGTAPVYDFGSANLSGVRLIPNIVQSGRFFFTVNNTSVGNELYSSDGTAANTQLFADINPGANSSDVQSAAVLGTNLAVSATVDGIGHELVALPLYSCLTDSDQDGVPDCIDTCPTDEAKTQTGLCGCGKADVDTDGDLVLDCRDECPTDSNKSLEGICGCGFKDLDRNVNGTVDCLDIRALRSTPPRPTLKVLASRNGVRVTMKRTKGITYESQYAVVKAQRPNVNTVTWRTKSSRNNVLTFRPISKNRTFVARYRLVVRNIGASSYSSAVRIRVK